MEINSIEGGIQGVVTAEAIVEGRMVLMISNSITKDFGSQADLPGCKTPDNTTEAAKARYCLTWAVDNAQPPLYDSYPTLSYALRQGFDQSANVPFTSKVRMTQPSMTEGDTIPSGWLALAFGQGIYTVPSGCYVYNVGLTIPGAYLTVANAGDDTEASAGKLKYTASASFAEVVEYNSSTGKLTFRILY